MQSFTHPFFEDLDIYKEAINSGIDINARSQLGRKQTALHAALECSRPSKPFVKLLIDAGCDLNLKDASGNTPLHIAAYSGLPEYVKLFLEAGADATLLNNENKTARQCNSKKVQAVFDDFEAEQARKTEAANK